ncbi:MAG TPA: Ig-like domain-containing domain [Fibrobacteraceae bacterium]|nr:Ig-like domain-containing domain [Fibrobacteraceae bacterium]
MDGKAHKLVPFLVLPLLWTCATMVAPSGGPEDKSPPRVVAVYPPPRSVNVSTTVDVRMQFNEWIMSTVPRTAIRVSPPLEERLQTEVDEDKLLLTSKAKLDTLTTYTFTVSSVLEDLHKNHVIRPFQLVFSTGPQVDTLQVRGWVQLPDSLQRKKIFPTVGLYPIGTENRDARKYLIKLRDSTFIGPDSAPRLLQEPVLFMSQTDSLGRFHIDGVGPGHYRIAAFLDLSNDNRIEPNLEIAGVGEKDIQVDSAFHDSLFFTLGDLDTASVRITGVSVQTSHLALLDFSRILVEDSSTWNSCGLWNKDSSLYARPDLAWITRDKNQLAFWFDSVATDSTYLIGCIAGQDSLGRMVSSQGGRMQVRWIPAKDSLPTQPPKFKILSSNPTTDSLPSLELAYTSPILGDSLQADLRLINLRDTLSVTVAQSSPVRLRIFPSQPLPMGSKFRLVQLHYDTLKSHADTTAVPEIKTSARTLGNFETINPIKLASLEAQVPRGTAATQVELRAVDNSWRWSTQCSPKGHFLFDRIPEGPYFLSFYQDLNGNGKSDPGSLVPYHPAEPWRPLLDTIWVGKDSSVVALDSLLSTVKLP